MPAAAAKNGKVSKADWKKAGVHNILLPSGVRVDVRIIDLPRMVETGQFPQHLLEVALNEASGKENATPSMELIQQQREFTDLIVRMAVVDPKLDPEDMEEVPYEDKAMILDIATRQRDYDAEGAHIAGLDSSERFRKFRRFLAGDEDVEGS